MPARGYKMADIVTLTDDGNDTAPTRVNIIDAMHKLVNGAKPNDYLFLHCGSFSLE